MNHVTFEEGDDVPSYIVVESEKIEADRERIFLRFNAYDPAYASQWLEALDKEISELAEFPGPLANAIDEVATANFGREVRRLLFFGPRRRKSGAAYHVLYTVFPADEDNIQVIRILRILHASRGTVEEATDPGGDS